MAKKILLMFVCLAMVVCFAACGEETPDTPDTGADAGLVTDAQGGDAQSADSTDASETEEPVAPEVAAFLKKFEGVWVVATSVQPMGDEFSYDYYEFTAGGLVAGSYPDDGTETVKITAIKSIAETADELDLVYESGDTKKITFIITDEGQAAILTPDGAQDYWLLADKNDMKGSVKDLAKYFLGMGDAGFDEH